MKECKSTNAPAMGFPKIDIKKKLADALRTEIIDQRLYDKIMAVYLIDPDNFVMNIKSLEDHYSNPTRVKLPKQQIFYGYEDTI